MALAFASLEEFENSQFLRLITKGFTAISEANLNMRIILGDCHWVVKPVAITRKNSLFLDSTHGAKASAYYI